MGNQKRVWGKLGYVFIHGLSREEGEKKRKLMFTRYVGSRE
jgi:hypothetical protein